MKKVQESNIIIFGKSSGIHHTKFTLQNYTLVHQKQQYMSSFIVWTLMWKVQDFMVQVMLGYFLLSWRFSKKDKW